MVDADKEVMIRGIALSELGSAYDNLRILIPKKNFERPSLAWRGDSIVLGSRMPRWAVRGWLDEDIGISDSQVGFVNLRPFGHIHEPSNDQAHARPLTADAFLTPPCRQRKSNYRIWPASDFGSFYGEALPKKVTCFSMPYRQGGGVCAHACLYMCCTMLSRQGLHVPTTHEVSFEHARLCGKIQQDGFFEICGLTASEMATLIKSPLIDGSALLEIAMIKQQSEDSDRIRIIHLIQQYLSQGIPVILIIDCGVLYPEIKHILKASHPQKETFPHAVVLVGTRFQKRGNEVTPFPEAFVYHDPKMGPYLEKSVWELISAARFRNHANQVAFLVPVPKRITVRMSDVRCFYTLFAGHKASLPHQRTFLGQSLLPVRPIRQYALVAQQKLEDTYFGSLPTKHKVRLFLRQNLKRFPAWIWAVETYHDVSRLEKHEALSVWLFDATEANIMKWPHGLCGFCQHEVFNCWLQGARAKNVVVRGNLKVTRKEILL